MTEKRLKRVKTLQQNTWSILQWEICNKHEKDVTSPVSVKILQLANENILLMRSQQ